MSDTIQKSSDLELFHYGVKGMEWGKRRPVGPDGLAKGTPSGNSTRGEKKAAKKIEKADKKFEKSAGSMDTFVKVHNAAADIANNEILPKINAKPKYNDAAMKGDLLNDTPIKRQYEKEYEREYVKALNRAASDLGTNASGTRKYAVTADAAGNWSVTTDEVKHAITTAFTVRLKKDAKGLITGLEIVDDSVSHSFKSSKDLELFGMDIKRTLFGA